MSEPMKVPPKLYSPKPYSTVGYLFLTTFWAFLLPGAIAHVVLIPLIIPLGLLFGDDMHFLSAVFVPLIFCVFLFYLSLKLLKRFSANHRAGRVPGSFALWIFPFWLPFFWGLTLTAVGFFVAPLSYDNLVICGFLGFSQYFILYIGTLITYGAEVFMAISCIANFLIAIAGTVYIARLAPPVPKLRDLILYATIILLLCGLIGLAYGHYRTKVLSPLHNRDEVVRDERGTPFRQDTDLTEHIPFAENNKLVKIESPTLIIDSEHPRIHGAFALYPLYAAAVEAIYRNTENLRFRPEHRHQRTHVAVGTSPQAFSALLSDEEQYRSDMLFMAHPSEGQLQQAEDAGVELVITPIGYEAFVFFVSTVNPVDGLTLDQIRDIYSKRITRWNEVGGRNERILPFQRPEGSGSQTAMQRVIGDVPMASPLQEEFRVGMGEIVRDVADYRNYGNAIGFSFRYYVEGLFKHDGVKLLNINGIAPTIENIQNGTYPLIGEIVIISRADNTNPNVPKLTEWFLSPQGQQLVQDVGYVPVELPSGNVSPILLKCDVDQSLQLSRSP